MKAKVILFRQSGKYYTEEEWEIPDKAIGPYDMEKSPDFRQIDSGPVLVVTQEPWGFPYIIQTTDQLEPVYKVLDKANALEPAQFKTGQDHLPPAFREINYRASTEAFAKLFNELAEVSGWRDNRPG